MNRMQESKFDNTIYLDQFSKVMVKLTLKSQVKPLIKI